MPSVQHLNSKQRRWLNSSHPERLHPPHQNGMNYAQVFSRPEHHWGFQTGIRANNTTVTASPLQRPLSLDLYTGAYIDIEEAGQGSSGIVYKAFHLGSRLVFARKSIRCRLSSAKQRQSIAAELGILQRCHSPYILSCYGAHFQDNHISLALEWMDLGSFDGLLRRCGPLPEPVLFCFVRAIVHGLIYLWECQGVIHRDHKPSNVLLNRRGEIKICDFSEATQIVNGYARSAVGTMGYMAPERVQGQPYTVQAEVWSLGVMLVELATGKFPFTLNYACHRKEMDPVTDASEVITGEHEGSSPLEIWEAILHEASPTLSPKHFSPELCDFVSLCLKKDPKERPTLRELSKHSLVQGALAADGAMKEWIKLNCSDDTPNSI